MASSYLPDQSPLDNAIYDPEYRFVKSALNFAKCHLTSTGEMIMIYSDLGEKIGLHNENFLSALCNDYQLRAEMVDSTSMPVSRKPYDPMK